MNKSESIKAGLRKRFQSGESKLAKRKCYVPFVHRCNSLSKAREATTR